jgi:hypothetical protein
MAKKINNIQETERTKREWSEGELIRTFKLNRIDVDAPRTPVMQEWLDVEIPVLNVGEQYMLDQDLAKAQK